MRIISNAITVVRLRIADFPALVFSLATLLFASNLFYVPHVLDRILHIGLGFIVVFTPLLLQKWPQRVSGIIAIAGTIAISTYAFYYFPISHHFIGLPPGTLQVVLGLLAIALAIFASWCVAGLSIPIVSLIVGMYAAAGPYLPSPFTHAGIGVDQAVQALYLTGRGIYGSITAVSANYIVLFILFAAYLARLEFVDFLIDKAHRVLGSTRGAAPKIAVVSSASLGLVMGSAYGNTAATGAVTIPLMKRTGFPPALAAAVEASASVGGQFVPPVLGGAVFLMVDILGISYATVMLACIPVAILFYFGIFLMVDMTVVRLRAAGRLVELPIGKSKDMPFGGWLKVIPVIVLITLLVQGYTPSFAGFWGLISILLVDLTESRNLGMTATNFLDGMIAGAKGSAIIVGIVGAAGIISATMSTTGLALSLSGILTDAADGSLLILLVLTALVMIVLGMGLPTLLVYLLMAVLIAPALITAGMPPIAAHLFLIYYSSMSSITPPVGPDNYISASIAGRDVNPLWVGFLSCRLAAPAFIVPFIFAYEPTMLLIFGFDAYGILALLSSGAGIYALCAAQTGVLLPSLDASGFLTRMLLLACSITLLWPQTLPTLVGAAVLVTIHGWLIMRGRHWASEGPHIPAAVPPGTQTAKTP